MDARSSIPDPVATPKDVPDRKLFLSPPPRLPLFTGEGKGTDYDIWSGEVEKLKDDPTLEEAEILIAVKKSLQG